MDRLPHKEMKRATRSEQPNQGSDLASGEASTHTMEESGRGELGGSPAEGNEVEGSESEGSDYVASASLGSESEESESEGSESEGSKPEGGESKETDFEDKESEGSESDGNDKLEFNAECSELEDDGSPLLPGLPNELTVDQICTKLPLKAFGILRKVNPAWRKAIRSRRVLNARVLSQSAERLLVHSHPFEIDFSCEQLYLYSAREDRCYELPLIKWVSRGIPWECQCIQLDGRIYVLGGGPGYGEASCDEPRFKKAGRFAKAGVHRKSKAYRNAYVLDLVGPRCGWKRCASMNEGRLKFGCGVMGGKIYVFGGATLYGPVPGCEVYDPKADDWSSIRPMKQSRFDHQVTTFRETFLVYGGEVFDQDYRGGPASGKKFLDPFDGNRVPNKSLRDATIMEAYHPVQDEWRQVEPFRKNDSERMFMVDEKFHLLTQTGIYVQDTDTNSWKLLYSNLFPRSSCKKIVPYSTVVVSDSLLRDHPNGIRDRNPSRRRVWK